MPHNAVLACHCLESYVHLAISGASRPPSFSQIKWPARTKLSKWKAQLMMATLLKDKGLIMIVLEREAIEGYAQSFTPESKSGGSAGSGDCCQCWQCCTFTFSQCCRCWRWSLGLGVVAVECCRVENRLFNLFYGLD